MIQRLLASVVVWSLVLVVFTGVSHAGFKDDFVEVLNLYYGNVCEAKIEGVINKTLRVDWTSETVMLHTMKVFAEIGDAKDELYRDGVRYFKFPNDVGGYNIIDWKTGSKRSVDERAKYYFSG